MLSELQSRGILKKLEVLSRHPSLEAWRLHLKKDDANIFACVNDGVASGKIAVPGAIQTDAFSGIDSMSKYLAAFGVKIAQRIRDQFTPLFDPAVDTLSSDVLAVNSNIKSKTGYSLYPAQLAAAEALKRRLSKAKFGLLIAECGSGKTKIGSAAISAAMQTALKATSREKSFNIVMCPSHVQEKWVREIHETIPRSRAAVVKSITELERLYSACEKGSDSYYIILSKEKARDGYMRRPAVLWNNRRKAFLCPDCMGTLEMDVTKDDASYRTKADHLHFRNERPDNRVCRHCGGMLWEAINPDRQSAWVKVTDYGFVHRSFAEKSLELPILSFSIETKLSNQ